MLLRMHQSKVSISISETRLIEFGVVPDVCNYTSATGVGDEKNERMWICDWKPRIWKKKLIIAYFLRINWIGLYLFILSRV